jgi:hypothetical protein
MLTTEQYIALLRPVTEKWLAVEAKALATASHPATASAYKGLMRTFADGALNEKVALLAGLPAPGPDPIPTPDPIPIPTPGGKIDLSTWTWTGDQDASGGFSGVAKIFQPPLKAQKGMDFNPDGSITFTARVIGATTSGSHYPRSELRELTNGKAAAWPVSKGAMLEAQLKVNEVPVKDGGIPGRIVIGQYHGPDDELARLYYDQGVIYWVNDKAGDAMKEPTFHLTDQKGAFSNIPLGDKFSYSMIVKSGKLSVSVLHGDKVYSRSESVGKFWTDSKLCYAKAGVYLGVGKAGSGAGSIGSGQGSATFFSIKMSH